MGCINESNDLLQVVNGYKALFSTILLIFQEIAVKCWKCRNIATNVGSIKIYDDGELNAIPDDHYESALCVWIRMVL